MGSAFSPPGNFHDLGFVAFRLRQVQRAVLYFMDSDDGPHTAATIAEKTGLSRKAVAGGLSRLKDQQLVEPVRPKRWVITADGRNVSTILRSR